MSGKPRSKLRLADADMSQKVGKAAYFKKLASLQRRMAQIQHAYLRSGQSGVIVCEGWDAAGKGGTIRRLSAALDPRSFKVWPIGPPRNYYLQRHYFLRFMERMPPSGAISVFDRSWYGRVLVERVEGLAPEHRWRAAYREINEFERLLVDDGLRIVKLFFHITPEEQLARFEERLRNPMKRWKLTYEDFRNRDRWSEYETAIDEMFARTSTKAAPWHLVPANDKKSARLDALGHIANRLGRGLDLSSDELHEGVLDEAEKHLNLDDELVASLRGRTE